MGDILFLAHRAPWPPDRGDRIRSWNILRKLVTIAPVHLACFVDDEADYVAAQSMAPMLASLHVEIRTRSRAVAACAALVQGLPLSLSMFASGTIQKYVNAVLANGNIDTVFGFSGQMAQFVPEKLDETRFVMDFVDVDSAKFASYAYAATGPMRWIQTREAKKLAAFETQIARRADASLFVSEAEAALFRSQSDIGMDTVIAVENGVDTENYDPHRSYILPEKHGPLIIFTGQMDYRPNIEAVTIFAEQAMPIIRAVQPDARFAIVGRKPGASVLALAQLPGVNVTGEVPDVRNWLAAADVVVAPLRIARGVQNKVLEAMAMARPVVVSPAAFEGIDAEDGLEVLVAQGAEQEAQAVLDILANPALGQHIGDAARARVIARYGWDARLAVLDSIVRP